MIDQRNNDLLPIDFENKGQAGMFPMA
jgi:hypothetical protein